MTRIFASTLFLLVLAAYGISQAKADIVWSCNAMAATPTPKTLDEGLVDALAGRVRFREGRAGTANLICPIGPSSEKLANFTVRSLHLTYRDGDGKEGPSVVSAALRRINKATGHVETVRNGGVSSNHDKATNSGPDGFASHQSATGGQTIGESLDLDRFYYYVQITLRRSDAAVPLVVQGAFLTN